MTFYFTDSKRPIFTYSSLYEILANNARLNPDKVYYYSANRPITYKQMCDESLQLAHHLHHHLKSSKNPVLAVSTTNNEAILHLTWACLAAGICLAFLPPSHDPMQLASLMAQIEAEILITDSPELQSQPWVRAYETLQSDKIYDLAAVVEPQLKTPAFIFQTSGTTGAAKWVQVNHGHYLSAIASMQEAGCLDHAMNQLVYITPPLSHSYGLSTLLEYSSASASIILPRGGAGLGAITDLISSPLAERITAIEGVSHFYTQMVRLITRIKLPQLTHIGFGGGALDKAVINGLQSVYPELSYSVRYGLTETPSVVSQKLFTPPYLDDWNSSGKILPIYNLHIVDQSGQDTAIGQEGEIHIKGDGLAWPYYGETAVTNYFPTGDIGYIHPDSQELHIVGRKSLFLKVRGYRISPEYIEAIIVTVDAVSECRVSGTDSGILAEIVRTDESVTQQTVLDFLATKLPSYALPETITFVAEIPRTSSGKIQRH